ncbi:hypothetical protein [Pseudomonas sp. NFACC45]|uniref:hypothetical protein n=1 Tax=Pseudomonas sp. NFACC45 TaxID=1566201 RepID=UPI0015A59751|nr:hypothetical protein [Pseudomonas sp. NFACC45]
MKKSVRMPPMNTPSSHTLDGLSGSPHPIGAVTALAMPKSQKLEQEDETFPFGV